MTIGDEIRKLNNDELAEFLSDISACKICKYFDEKHDKCGAPADFLCTKAYAEAIIGDWLKQQVEE